MDIYQSNGIASSYTEWQLECVSARWTLKCTGVIYFTFKRLDVTTIQMLSKVIVSLKQVYNMIIFLTFMIVACQIVCYVDCTTSMPFLYQTIWYTSWEFGLDWQRWLTIINQVTFSHPHWHAELKWKCINSSKQVCWQCLSWKRWKQVEECLICLGKKREFMDFFHNVIGNMMKEILKFCQNVMALMSFQISMTCFSKLVFAQIN